MTTSTTNMSSTVTTLYHVPKTISSPIYQCMIELDLPIQVIAGSSSGSEADSPAVSDSTNANNDMVNGKNILRVNTITFPELKSPEHLQRNPMGTSPTLQQQKVDPSTGSDHNQDDNNNDDETFTIWESGAVLSFLLLKYDTEYKLHPDPQTSSQSQIATFMHLQQYIIATVYPFVATLYIHTLKPFEEQDVDYVKDAKTKFRTLIGPTLSNFLGNKEYFMGGSNPTAIDYLVTKPLNNAHSMGILDESEFPTLAGLFRRIRCRPSFQTAYGVIDGSDNDDQCNCRSLHVIPG
jgi:glutathione S-transferase